MSGFRRFLPSLADFGEFAILLPVVALLYLIVIPAQAVGWLAFHTRWGLGLMTRAAWRTRHPGHRETQARRALGVPIGHPERVSGSDTAAQREYFQWLTCELARDGIDAGVIIEQVRRGL